MPRTQTGHAAAQDHQHEISLEDTFEFLNTIELQSGALVDSFRTFNDAASWLIARGVCHSGGPETLRPAGVTAAEALERVRSVREALREVADAVAHERPASDAAIAEVNRAIQARERVELVPAADGASVGHSHVGDPLDDALARLADPFVNELAAGNDDRVRICDNDTCRWFFYDESRAGRRRWCDMASCGNRAKAARHRARVKAAASAEAAPPN